MELAAIRAMCELLVTAPHFNFRNDITMRLVPLANSPADQVWIFWMWAKYSWVVCKQVSNFCMIFCMFVMGPSMCWTYVLRNNVILSTMFSCVRFRRCAWARLRICFKRTLRAISPQMWCEPSRCWLRTSPIKSVRRYGTLWYQI